MAILCCVEHSKEGLALQLLAEAKGSIMPSLSLCLHGEGYEHVSLFSDLQSHEVGMPTNLTLNVKHTSLTVS